MEGHIQIQSRSADLRLPRSAATAPLPESAASVPSVPAGSGDSMRGDVQRVQDTSERLFALVEPGIQDRMDAIRQQAALSDRSEMLRLRLVQLVKRSAASGGAIIGPGELRDLAQRLEKATTPEELDKIALELQRAEGEISNRGLLEQHLKEAEARSEALASAARKAIFDYIERCKLELSHLLRSLDIRSREHATQISQVVSQGTEESLKAMARLGLTTDTDVSNPAAIPSSFR
jgi:hypothetical protein